MNKGIFITFEGGEASGKSTTIKQVVQYLEQQGYKVLATREPGGTLISEQVRDILLNDHRHNNMDPYTEAYLFAAARRQHMVEVILPALEEGKIVLCDRHIDSSLIYQGIARDLGIDTVKDINKYAMTYKEEVVYPDLTVYFYTGVLTSMQRTKQREGLQDRLDNETQDFHEKVCDGYLTLASEDSKRIRMVDAEQDIEKVVQNTLKIIRKKIEGVHK